MTHESERHPFDFWRQQALQARLSLPLVDPVDAAPSVLTDEDEELLWAFAESELSETDMQRVSQLLTHNSAARDCLREIFQAIETTTSTPASDPHTLWTQFTSRRSTAPLADASGLFDIVVRIVSDGLELLATTGQAAYAPAWARSESDPHTSTAALEFLTSIGTFQIIIDQVDANCCNVTVRPTQLAGLKEVDRLELAIHDSDGRLIRTDPFEDGRVRIQDVSPGRYRLVVLDRTTARTDFSIDIQCDA